MSIFNRKHSVDARINRRALKRLLRCEGLEKRIVLTSYIVDTIDDSIAADGMVSLREAITAANTNLEFFDAPAGDAGPAGIDLIRFAPELSGQVITLGDLGSLQVIDSLQIADTNTRPVVIDGNSQQIFNVDTNSVSLGIANITLLNGSAGQGGAVFVGANSSLSVSNAVLQNNIADDGGAIYSLGSVTILNSTLTNNEARQTSGSGGAIYSASGSIAIIASDLSFNSATRAGGGIEIVDGSLSLLNTNLVRNDVNGSAGPGNPGNGGGIHITGSAAVAITGGVISGNSAASEGGGLWNQAGSTMAIRNTRIAFNEAFGDDATNGGGGIFNNGGIVNVTGAATTISNNFASGVSGSGGGLFNDAGGVINITDATISGNVANRAGGGIEAVAGSATNLTNVLLTANNVGVSPDAVAAPGNGGGLHITGAGDATIIGGEVSDNVAAREGGGLWNGSGTMSIDGSLIVGNTASGPAAHDGGGGIFNNGGTLQINAATISDNIADGTAGSGGGLFSLAGPVSVVGTTFSFNSANRAGGGIEVVDGTVDIDFTTFSSNDVNATAGTPAPGNGGGIHTSGVAGIEVAGGSFVDNKAAREGGAIWISAGTTLATSGDLVLVNNSAHGNAADDGGGAIFNDGGTATLTDTLFIGNTADGSSGSGGAILNLGGSITGSDLFISSNFANRAGGGIEDNAGSLQLTRTTLANNSATSAPGNGGGLHITGASTVEILQSTVRQNSAAAEGGGLWNSAAGSLTVTDVTVDGNSATTGGGIFQDGLGGTTSVVSSTVSRNRATGAGGGILSEGGQLDVLNSTVSSNTAATGGGVQLQDGVNSFTSVTVAANSASTDGGGIWIVGGSATAINSLIATNTAGTGPDVLGTLQSDGNNLVGNTSGATITGTTATNLNDIAAEIGPLQNNGGLTETHALLSSSPAINTGNATVPAIDQRGTARPRGAAFDIGSYEAAPAALRSSMLSRADVSGDGTVSPIDALLVINRLNQSAEGENSIANVDVNGDGFVSPIDALAVINLLNSGGDMMVDSSEIDSTDAPGVDDSVAAADIADWLDDLKRRQFDFDDSTWTDLAEHRSRVS